MGTCTCGKHRRGPLEYFLKFNEHLCEQIILMTDSTRHHKRGSKSCKTDTKIMINFNNSMIFCCVRSTLFFFLYSALVPVIKKSFIDFSRHNIAADSGKNI